jgi:hypothetical protein
MTVLAVGLAVATLAALAIRWWRGSPRAFDLDDEAYGARTRHPSVSNVRPFRRPPLYDQETDHAQ